MKKILTLLLSAVMVLAMMPSMAFAEDGNVAKIGETEYATLQDAVNAVTDNTPTTIKLLRDAQGNGVIVESGKNITFDLGGFTYEVNGELVGSTGTETNGFQLLKDSTIEFKNGKLYSEIAAFLIQNYSNLTLNNVEVDGSNLNRYSDPYTLSNNNGQINLTNNTKITANDGKVAFDVCRYANYESVSVTVENAIINGGIEVSASKNDIKKGCNLFIKGGDLTNATLDVQVNDATIEVTGGSFSTDPTQYVADDYFAYQMNDKYVVSDKDFTAKDWTFEQDKDNDKLFIGTYHEPTPPAPPVVTPSVPKDPVTNTGTSDSDNATTNADISKDTTSKTETVTETKPDGTTSTTTTTTVSKETADKIVDKAVEHQSAEVVVDTTTNSLAPVAGDKTEVKLPAETMQTLAEKTTADVTIKSDVAEVTLDAKAVDAVAEQIAETKAETVTLVVENTKNDAEEMRFELELVTESGKVYDFNGGNVSVTVKLNKTLQAAEKLVCVYIDDNGVMSKVEGYKNADGTFTFVTGHFSTYAIMAEDEADKLIEEQTNARIIAGVQNTTIKATSEAGKGYLRVKWNKSKGYKVDYFEVYKAKSKTALKASKKPYFETKSGTWKSYKNTKALKKGTRYYYRVRGVREINGQTYYTNFSTIAYRIAK